MPHTHIHTIYIPHHTYIHHTHIYHTHICIHTHHTIHLPATYTQNTHTYAPLAHNTHTYHIYHTTYTISAIHIHIPHYTRYTYYSHTTYIHHYTQTSHRPHTYLHTHIPTHIYTHSTPTYTTCKDIHYTQIHICPPHNPPHSFLKTFTPHNNPILKDRFHKSL